MNSVLLQGGHKKIDFVQNSILELHLGVLRSSRYVNIDPFISHEDVDPR